MPIRLVLRATKVYTALLRLAAEQPFVGSGVQRSAVLDRMSRYFVDVAGAPPTDWPVFRDEFESLFRFDVPYFSVGASDSDLVLEGGERLARYFVRSGFDSAIQKIESLCSGDLQMQEAFIRSAFLLKQHTELHVVEREPYAPEPPLDAPRLSSRQYLEVAEEIATDIEEREIRADDGSLTWICANRMTRAPQYCLKPVDDMLFAGSTGIALFFAAVHAAGGDAHWRETASRRCPRCADAWWGGGEVTGWMEPTWERASDSAR